MSPDPPVSVSLRNTPSGLPDRPFRRTSSSDPTQPPLPETYVSDRQRTVSTEKPLDLSRTPFFLQVRPKSPGTRNDRRKRRRGRRTDGRPGDRFRDSGYTRTVGYIEQTSRPTSRHYTVGSVRCCRMCCNSWRSLPCRCSNSENCSGRTVSCDCTR